MDGELEQVEGGWRLRFTRRLAHSPAAVWRALTEPDLLATWFPTLIEGAREAGAPLRFRFANGEGPIFDGEMLAYDPPSLLEFRWGTDTLRFELQPDGDGCLLTFFDTFDDLGRAARDAAGWHSCLDRLAFAVAGETPPWGPRERWAEVHAIYLKRFPPEAATLGPPAQS